MRWAQGQETPWLLFSDRPGGAARVREYRRRVRVEATSADDKRRGWKLSAGRIQKRDRFDRLLLALALAYWWANQLGLREVRHGERRPFDHAGHRAMSLIRLGRLSLVERCPHDRHPPPPLLGTTPRGWMDPVLA